MTNQPYRKTPNPFDTTANVGQSFERRISPVTYSMAHIVFMDGTNTEVMVKASPSVAHNLVKDIGAHGYLVLWNDSDTLCVRAETIKHFSMREVTNGVTK